MGVSIRMMLTTVAVKGRLSMIKRQCIAIICVFVLMTVLTACTENYLPENDNDVDTAFEQDYALIDEATSHLLVLEESRVRIKCQQKEITGELGEPMEFQSSEMEEIVEKLKSKGYYCITKRENVVIFEVWRKSFDVEFEAGFVYSIDGSGDLSEIAYLTYQNPLSKQNWYYYEADYNEWRNNRLDK